MTGNTLGWVIVAFVLYLLMMIAIGAFYAKGNNNSEDYFLGGRKLNGFVAAPRVILILCGVRKNIHTTGFLFMNMIYSYC